MNSFFPGTAQIFNVFLPFLKGGETARIRDPKVCELQISVKGLYALGQ